MPFKSPDVTNFPAALPLVKVFFNGLMIVKPDANGNECEIFVHKTATDHEFSVEIRLKVPNKPDEIRMRHLGQLQRIDPANGKQGFMLTTTAAHGVFRYAGPTTSTADPLNPEVVFDLDRLHHGKTAVNTANAEPAIFMNDALFYCAQKTVPGLQVELRNAQTGAVVPPPLTQICSVLGANIYGTSVDVRWREHGQLRVLSLSNNIPTDAHWEVYFVNDPAFVPHPNPGQQPHDELGEYYKILPNVPNSEKLKLFFTNIPQEPFTEADKGSNRIPCMTVIDNGP